MHCAMAGMPGSPRDDSDEHAACLPDLAGPGHRADRLAQLKVKHMNMHSSPTTGIGRDFGRKNHGDDDAGGPDAAAVHELRRIAAEFSSFATARKAKEGELSARLTDLEQRSVRRGSSGAGIEGIESNAELVKSFDDSPELKALREHRRGAVASLDLPHNFFHGKATLLSGDPGSLGQVDRPSGSSIYGPPMPPLRIRNLLQALPTTAAAVPFVQGTFANAAVVQVEGTRKTESEATAVLKLAPVQTIAHWIRASNQILDDTAGLLDWLSVRMRFGLGQNEEAELLYGSGIAPHLGGLFPAAPVFSNQTAGDLVSTLRNAKAALEQQGYAATALVLNPVTLASLELLKLADGSFLIGQPRGGSPPNLWGVPIVSSPGMDEQDWLMGDVGMSATIYDRRQVRVIIATQNEDDFIKNLITILCEERLALAVTTPTALLRGHYLAA
jgi:HK97 family phage major capsid protein